MDEPTNDLDIPTLNVLEEYLMNFQGCLIVVSHDRYFMDRVVDHLFVFHGNGEIQDFPGNYTQYRLEGQNDSNPAKVEKTIAKVEKVKTEKKRRLSFKEKQELEELEKQMPILEDEKAQLEALLSGGATDPNEISKTSARYKEVQEALDLAEMRWLELSEVES
ncbi:MAG: hypothetical protein IJ989_00850 [Paludibacteraceae bacterium]|nr:hypothetical protein [Paludibacteraceae bacterium]